MRGYRIELLIVTACLTVCIGSCKKDDGQPTTPITQGGQLTAVPAGVTVGLGQVQNVMIAAGSRPYTVAQAPSGNLATAQFIDANLDTAVLVITGVTSATGATSVIVRDASTPQKGVTVGIIKIQ